MHLTFIVILSQIWPYFFHLMYCWTFFFWISLFFFLVFWNDFFFSFHFSFPILIWKIQIVPFFCWGIVDLNIILVSGIQCSDSKMFTYCTSFIVIIKIHCIACAVQYILVSYYFILSSLYLLIPYCYHAPPPAPLPSGNH